MTRTRSIMTAAALFGSLVLALVVPAGASAGGWAVTTLDAAPEIEAGEPEQIGFTIRQHGVSPVDVEDVSLVVTDASGATQRFDAVAAGVPGHYVAVVELATAGDFTWAVDQGWFGRQELGSLSVSGTSVAGATGGDHRAPEPIRWGLPLLAGLLGLLAVGEMVSRRVRLRSLPA